MSELTRFPEEHPCFSPQAHGRFARIHLPVAPLDRLLTTVLAEDFPLSAAT